MYTLIKIDHAKTQHQQHSNHLHTDLTNLKTSYKHLSNENDEKTRILIRIEKASKDLKNKYKLEMNALERRLGDENKELRYD